MLVWRASHIFLMYAGAILFRGFHVNEGVEFQDVVQQYNPELSDQYRGTSPRKLVPGTKVGRREGGGEGGRKRKGGRKTGKGRYKMMTIPLHSMSSLPVSFHRSFRSPNTLRCRSSRHLLANCSSAVWRPQRLPEGKLVSVISRRFTTRWIQKSDRHLRRRE